MHRPSDFVDFANLLWHKNLIFFVKASMKKIKSGCALLAGVIISFAACHYNENESGSSAASNGTPSGAGSAGTGTGVATDNNNAVNLSLTDTLLRSDSTNRDTLR